MPSRYGSRQELGQNFLVDPDIIKLIRRAAERTEGPIVDLGAGDGALTLPLSRLGRPVTAVELDPRRVKRLSARAPENVKVVGEDILRFRLPTVPHTVVGNIPFHVTTATMRRILVAPAWVSAVLVVQWEVARRRAGIGGCSLVTAESWPWFDFSVLKRVPRFAFRPAPSVDGGILVIERRPEPLVRERREYQDFVRQVFTGRGHGLREILQRIGRVQDSDLSAWFRAHGVSPQALPKDLTAEQWASLWGMARGGRSVPRTRRPRGLPPRTSRGPRRNSG
ncbi:lmrB [Streptomyces lincolnensis]|uniref:LmrB n=1 Tax=Streptomyces lincolnensis TaxID=1915 RepID=Q54377_STRLN|nr:23S rRNA (adenine(2058)-N(6))-methyltransferase Erm(U) [Streptomyces lincolnensis]ABX00620.1 LmrB [Streptomyces lincolnensis]ANS62480.1 lmrB [Streptomyces lincolnensis]QMV04469.1 23S rRNA (adenine(2058)-N(6))-methyltransferase Erm(U) [Streptomyces lincolnensis]QMV11855.1 23S rRNA (adenine(2058)-N(6))-methyltransferase Erm(U) [Streptomyces lincolnensis]CAA55770.1 lmrB [Streptomyces lincolnensis]